MEDARRKTVETVSQVTGRMEVRFHWWREERD